MPGAVRTQPVAHGQGEEYRGQAGPSKATSALGCPHFGGAEQSPDMTWVLGCMEGPACLQADARTSHSHRSQCPPLPFEQWLESQVNSSSAISPASAAVRV